MASKCMTVTSILLIVGEIDPSVSQMDHAMCGEYKHATADCLVKYQVPAAKRLGKDPHTEIRTPR
jgi:hypothetical protein